MPKLPKGMKRRRNAYYLRRIKDGREVWVPLGSDYAEACRKLRATKHEPVKRNRGTIAELANEWLATYIGTARNEKGQKLTAQRVERFFKPFLGTRLLTRVTANDLRKYRIWLEEKDLAMQSVSHILADARCFFRWAESSEYINRSPFPKRLLPRLQERAPDRLTDAEVAALVSIPEPWGFVMRFALGSGLRWGELTRAKASDVTDGVLTVAHTKSYRVRRVPLPRELAGEIRSRVGLLVPQANYWHSVLRIRQLSGVARFHPHQTRHTFSCKWLEAGGSLAALQQMLGHASITTTQRYAKLSDDLVRAEAERVMGNAMGNIRPQSGLTQARRIW